MFTDKLETASALFQELKSNCFGKGSCLLWLDWCYQYCLQHIYTSFGSLGADVTGGFHEDIHIYIADSSRHWPGSHKPTIICQLQSNDVNSPVKHPWG